MLFQSDAQQVRAARLLHRVRWIRVRFGHPPTSLKHGPTSPCITLAMVHGCSPCAFKASAMSWSAWDSNVHSDQIRACEKVCTRHDQWQLRRTAGHASVERRRAAAPALLICSPRSTIAPRVMWSSFEMETGAIFDAQPSLTVVYDTSKLTNCARSQLDAQEALQRSCYTCTVKIVTKWPT